MADQLDGYKDYKYKQLGKQTDIRPPRSANSSAAAEDAMNAMLKDQQIHQQPPKML